MFLKVTYQLSNFRPKKQNTHTHKKKKHKKQPTIDFSKDRIGNGTENTILSLTKTWPIFTKVLNTVLNAVV